MSSHCRPLSRLAIYLFLFTLDPSQLACDCCRCDFHFHWCQSRFHLQTRHQSRHFLTDFKKYYTPVSNSSCLALLSLQIAINFPLIFYWILADSFKYLCKINGRKKRSKEIWSIKKSIPVSKLNFLKKSSPNFNWKVSENEKSKK